MKTFRQAFKIEDCDCLEVAWELVTKTLSTTVASEAKAPLPKRDASPLDRLIRKPAKNRSRKNNVSIETFGLTGFEMGNWVNSSDGKVLQRLAFDAFSDLVSILGSQFVSLVQEGNLALSLGARGSGRACATYNSKLKVINLTKTKGDGSLAHEVGHFLDNKIDRTNESTLN